MPGKLEGKVAIVTGSDSGIGQAIAVEFANEGAHVAITYLHDKNGALETGRQVQAAGRRPLVVNVDVRDPQDVERLFRLTQDQFGPPYILVNNAGVAGQEKEAADLTLEEWNEVIDTNLTGPFLCSQQFIRARRAAGGGGKLINITSVHEDMPSVGFAHYDAAKGGLRNLTRTLCLELARDRINVNNIAPGMVLTPMNQEALDDPKARARDVKEIPLKRAAEPWEIARLALYLASGDADYATGQSFVLDGGMLMNFSAG